MQLHPKRYSTHFLHIFKIDFEARYLFCMFIACFFIIHFSETEWKSFKQSWKNKLNFKRGKKGI